MSKKGAKRPHGEIRQSQVVTSFGPGATLELPKHSVLVGGLEFWSAGGDEVHEARLIEKLKRLLGAPELRLLTPPPAQDEPAAPATGITCWQFPEWFITQEVVMEKDSPVRSRMLVHRRSLSKGKFTNKDKKKLTVVPVRFIRACRSGHIGDIDWQAFVHEGASACRLQLWLDEHGTSGNLDDVWVRCECGQRRNLGVAAKEPRVLGNCDGGRPWLGRDIHNHEKCGEPNRLLIRTASNAYFPQQMSVISLPDRDEALAAAVVAAWEFIEVVEDLDQLKYERKKAKVKEALEGFSDEDVFAAVQAKRGFQLESPKSVKQAELETLIASKEELGADRPDGNFFARALPKNVWDTPWMNAVERVVLVHRLREVVAQVGFTRFEAAAPDIEGELEMGVRRAALAREVSWLPAIENKGEGVFLQFNRQRIEAWADRPDVQARGRKLLAGFDCWKAEHQGTHRKFPGMPYILLHSLSHMLITAVALECGYPASSIRERIYAIHHFGYGILLHTGSSDAEGTLGGLVEVGRRVHEHVRAALRLGELCSNDPVCAQHEPQNAHERRFLLGAACHGCLLIAETSCEQHNDFLDRALVTPTVDNLGIEFFAAGQT
ncbi:MAG TPA: DUF1998 domain-containing protein [Pirellulales bacterium]